VTPEPRALFEAAGVWLDGDPDPADRARLAALRDAALDGDGGARRELAGWLGEPLRFGTAGLRGPLRPGPAGMNVAVVTRASAGLARWLAGRGLGGGLVVVGRDARHGSAAFARAAAGVLAGAGFQVRALGEPLPTPVLAHAVRLWDAVAGVQVTASHNPPQDNGYKVYLGGADGGAQLVEPADAQVEAAIAATGPAREVPVRPVEPVDPGPLLESYLSRVAALSGGGTVPGSGGGPDPGDGPRIALTPLHGVGGPTAVRALHRAGFPDVHLVPAQARPDPDFPTVRFPNPEEPGATDALLAHARAVGAELAVALDPDADRCALGVPDPDVPGGWRMLTGNETGVLLGDHLLARLDRTRHPDPLVASTLASGTQLRAVAAARGARFAETPTGFKWIVRAGAGFVYGYEEALGYCVDPDTVRDKDGIAAAVLAADLLRARRVTGGTLLDALDELAVAHGVHQTGAVTVRMDPAAAGALLRGLAEGPVPLGGRREQPAPGVLVLRGERSRVALRASGTEPKLKAYLEVVEPVGDPDALPGARRRAAGRLRALHAAVEELITPGSGPGNAVTDQ
jgi:phosphomannomutase